MLRNRLKHNFDNKGRTFNVEQRWILGRELGQGAYGVVVCVHARACHGALHSLTTVRSAAEDKISGETVAIKLVTRVFEKVRPCMRGSLACM